MRTLRHLPRIVRNAGVTLIELAIVIALTGILAVLVVQFAVPVRSYIDSSRRAALADAADSALRRIGRDVRLALPNSVRVKTDGGVTYVEMLLVRTAGRYRLESAGGAVPNGCPDGLAGDIDPVENVLSFSSADSCFKTIGGTPNIADVVAGDFLVVFNLPQTTPPTPNADAYESEGATGGNKSKIVSRTAGTGEDLIRFESNSFMYESPGRRFFIIEGPVTYACDPVAGTLRRFSGYTIAAAQPTPPGGTGALMASGVVAPCNITYDSSTAVGAGLLTMALRLRMQDSRGASEDVNLYHAVHVNNVP